MRDKFAAMQLGAILSIAAGCAAMAAAAAQASLPRRLSQAAPGIWEISGVPSAKAPVRQCVSDLLRWPIRAPRAALHAHGHPGRAARRRSIIAVGSAGFGRSQVELITPRSLRIETQGSPVGCRFNYVIQARRSRRLSNADATPHPAIKAPFNHRVVKKIGAGFGTLSSQSGSFARYLGRHSSRTGGPSFSGNRA